MAGPGKDVDMKDMDAVSDASSDFEEQVIDVAELEALAAAGDVAIMEDNGAAPEEEDDDDDMDGEDGDEDMQAVPDMASAVLKGHDKPVHTVAIHPSNPVVATGGEDDKVFLWNVEPHLPAPEDGPKELTPAKELAGHTDTVVAVAFSADGSMLATGGMDGRMILWTAEGEQVAVTEDLGDAIAYLFWHPKGKIVFAGSADSQSAMWNDKGTCMTFFTGHAAEVTCGCLASDGKMLVTGSEDLSVRVFAPKTGEQLVHFSNTAKGMHTLPQEPPTALAAHPRVSDIVIAGWTGGQVSLMSIGAKKVLSVTKTHPSAVERIVASSLLPIFASCCAGENGNLHLWNADTANATVRDSLTQDAGVVDMQWVGEHLYAIDTQGEVKRFAGRSLNASKPVVWTGHMDSGLCLAVHEDGWVASGSDDTTVRVFPPQA
eukprot:TRINITY_DN11959_c0_g1_i1.p1 TRINITY_DN11959_c0_g1~~TRINITY_DN11959_c0_g1_i1.p1  ORF type:complete len:431 (+),score=183.86 TRINITY_DN11959_c0_g1_i1:61-1353(+)